MWTSFVLGTIVSGQDYWLLRLSNGLFIEGEFLKILAVTGIVLLISHGLDLYDSSTLGTRWDQVSRLLMVLAVVALSLAAVGYLYRYFLPGHNFLPRDSALAGLIILTFALFAWRATYSSWLVRQRYVRERIYVLGTGERAQRLLDGLQQSGRVGIEVVGWTGQIASASEASKESVGMDGLLPRKADWGSIAGVQSPDLLAKVAIMQEQAEAEELPLPATIEAELTREAVANHFAGPGTENWSASRDRGDAGPARDAPRKGISHLFAAAAWGTVAGVKRALEGTMTNWLEKMSGKIEVEHLYPSWLDFRRGIPV